MQGSFRYPILVVVFLFARSNAIPCPLFGDEPNHQAEFPATVFWHCEHQGIVSGTVAQALVALTGNAQGFLSTKGKTDQQFGHSIEQKLLSGPVEVATWKDASGKKEAFSLGGPRDGNVYFDHAYVVERVDTDDDGNVVDVVLLNPWGVGSKYDYEIKVPVGDFRKLFAGIFYVE